LNTDIAAEDGDGGYNVIMGLNFGNDFERTTVHFFIVAPGGE
jgi:hypothetical protein